MIWGSRGDRKGKGLFCSSACSTSQPDVGKEWGEHPNGSLSVGSRSGTEGLGPPCRSAQFPSRSRFYFISSQCFVTATHAFQWRQQPATAGADVSFPEGLSQPQGWSDRDLYLFFNKYGNFCGLFPEGSRRATAITAKSIP